MSVSYSKLFRIHQRSNLLTVVRLSAIAPQNHKSDTRFHDCRCSPLDIRLPQKPNKNRRNTADEDGKDGHLDEPSLSSFDFYLFCQRERFHGVEEMVC
jgi:hypothetical protein